MLNKGEEGGQGFTPSRSHPTMQIGVLKLSIIGVFLCKEQGDDAHSIAQIGSPRGADITGEAEINLVGIALLLAVTEGAIVPHLVGDGFLQCAAADVALHVGKVHTPHAAAQGRSDFLAQLLVTVEGWIADDVAVVNNLDRAVEIILPAPFPVGFVDP